MRMPYEAATPVPTMTAVGVARPSAQGQAMTKVDMPKLKANWNLLIPFRLIESMPCYEYAMGNHIIQATNVNNMTNGTKYFEMRSASP